MKKSTIYGEETYGEDVVCNICGELRRRAGVPLVPLLGRKGRGKECGWSAGRGAA